jgi:hypothetical protein
MFTLKTSDFDTTGAKAGSPTSQDPGHGKTLPAPMIRGPQELPRTARGSWRRSDERDWTSVGRSSDPTQANTNEILSVRLVQSPNSGVDGGSPPLGGMETHGAAPVNVYNSLEDKGKYVGKSQDNIGPLSNRSSGIDNKGDHWKSVDRMFSQSTRGSNFGVLEGSQNSTDSGDSHQSENQHGGNDENGHRRWHQKRRSCRDSIDDIVEYRVSRVSGPLSPVNQNVDWDNATPGRPRLVEIAREKRVDSSSNSVHGSEEVAFV